MVEKVLFISLPSTLPYSNAIKKALIQKGCTVFEPEYLDNDSVKDNQSIRVKQNKKYIEAIDKHDIDFILVINHAYANREFFDYCHSKGIKVFLYTMDSVRWCDYAVEHLDDYTGVYSYEPTDCNNELLSSKIKYLPIGYDEELLYENHEEYKYDICFVGALDKRRIETLSAVADYAKKNGKRMIVYTAIQLKHFSGIKTVGKILSRKIRFRLKYPNLYKAIENKPILGDDLRALYNSCKICLNINQNTNHPEWHTGVNPRTFEIMGCKAFEIMDEGHLGTVDIKNGADLVEYSSVHDLIEKIDYYLSHDESRSQIAASGYNKVRDKYTSNAIVSELLNSIRLLL